MKRRALLTTLATLAAGAAGHAHAATYPERPLRWVVPFPAGGPVDVVARRLAEAVSGRLGQPIVVDNKPGASGSIGTADVARAAPDGYTLGLAIPDSLIGVASLVKSPPYDARKDLSLIAKLVASPLVMMVSPDTGAASVAELMARAKARPGAVAYGSWGPGTMPQLLMASVESATSARFNHVPYRGVAPALQDLAARQVQVGFGPAHVAAQYAQKGIAIPVALTGTERSPLLPQVPTFAEQGYAGAIETSRIWIGLVGPQGLPRDTVTRLNDLLTLVVNSPEFRSFLNGIGFVPALSGPDTFAKDLRHEFDVTHALIRRLGVQPE